MCSGRALTQILTFSSFFYIEAWHKNTKFRIMLFVSMWLCVKHVPQ